MSRTSGLVVALLSAGCVGEVSPKPVADPIAGIPPSQLRVVSRSEFRLVWPFSVGAGTIGCLSEAVVFRAGGVNYGLNDAARSRGFAAVDPLWLTHHVAPSNPLSRVTQERRMQIFAEFSACDSAACRKLLLPRYAVSDAELKQIETEGVERRWPPLTPRRVSLDPIVEAGLRLCRL